MRVERAFKTFVSQIYFNHTPSFSPNNHTTQSPHQLVLPRLSGIQNRKSGSSAMAAAGGLASVSLLAFAARLGHFCAQARHKWGSSRSQACAGGHRPVEHSARLRCGHRVMSPPLAATAAVAAAGLERVQRRNVEEIWERTSERGAAARSHCLGRRPAELSGLGASPSLPIR